MAWHENDSFWETFAPFLFSASRWEQAPEEIDAVLALAGSQPPAAVLDLCCGPGRHALELARRGFRVTGVDRTRSYLEEARKRAQGEDLDLELVEADMRSFVRDASFALALNLFTSFSFTADPADDRRVLSNLYRSLVPGGTLLVDMMGKEILARMYRERDWYRLDDGSLLLEEREVIGPWEGIRSRWTRVLPDGGTTGETVELRLYSACDLRGLLEETGFGEVRVFGGFDGRPYDHRAERLVVLGVKGG